MYSEAADRAQEAPRTHEQFSATDRRFQEAIRRFRQAGAALTAERDRLQGLLDATEGVDQPTDKETAP